MSELTQHSATDLCRLLASGEVSSEEVTRSHLERIAALDGELRAFAEVLKSEALAAARRADAERRRGEVRGPLHGLPVTVKESLDMTGCPSTLGLPSRRGAFATRDAVVVRLLRDAGAVVLGRTNLSQMMLFHESRNALFGQTQNPFSAGHTSGGSSGGESAAIAAGMSPLGVGTDIGGSIRVPCHFSGIAGLKPTLDRWSNQGGNTVMLGQEVVRSQLGPMARTARDVALAMATLDPRAMSAVDPRVPPLAIGDPADVELGGLRVGVYVEDGLVPVSSAVARAVGRASAALRSAGATLVDFRPPGVEDAIYDYVAAMSADGARTAAGALAGDAIDPALASMFRVAKLPASVRRGLSRVASLAGEKRVARTLDALGEKPVAEYWRLTHRIRAARAAILEAMTAASLDLVLCPPHATPALPHGLSNEFVLAGSHSILYNLCQFPAGVVPVTRVRASETRREMARDRLEKRAAEVDRQSEGLPVGVQVVARPWREDLVLAAMLAIENDVAADPERPITPHPPK